MVASVHCLLVASCCVTSPPPHYSWEKAVITQLLQGGGPAPPLLQLGEGCPPNSSPACPCPAASCSTSQQQPKKGEGGNNFTTFLWTLNLESINKTVKNPDRIQFKHSLWDIQKSIKVIASLSPPPLHSQLAGGGGGMGGMTLGWCGGKGEGTDRKPLCESTGVRESLITLVVVALFLHFIKAFKNGKKLSTSWN